MKENYLLKIIICMLFMFSSVFSLFSQTRELVWSDEFNYTGLPDAEKWIMQTGGSGYGNQELQYFTDREENAFVDNGVLTYSNGVSVFTYTWNPDIYSIDIEWNYDATTTRPHSY